MPDSEPIDLLLAVDLQHPCEDYYFPEPAACLLPAIAALDDQSAAVTIALVAYEAEAGMMRN